MKKSKLIAIIATLAVAGAAVVVFTPQDDSADVPTWNMGVVEALKITNSVTATGTIEPVTKVDVGTQVSGILMDLYVDYNSMVKKGEIIAELDKSLLKIDLNDKKTSVARTHAELIFQEANFKRVKALHERELIAQSE